MIRRLAYLLSLAAVVLATVAVPMPLVEFSPGGATSIPQELVDVADDVDVTPIHGDLSLLTVRLSQPTVAEVVRAWFDRDRDLAARSQVFPEGIGSQDYFDLQQSEFQRTFELAVAVGLRAAGEDIEFSSAPLVAQVVAGGPADGQLRAGDVILAIDGTPVSSGTELIAESRGLEVGEPVTLTVERGGEELRVELVAGRVAGLDRPGIGVSLLDVTDDVDLPVDVTMRDTRIGGPSAGMMIALTAYDLFSDEDLTAGRAIAGTGTIDADGNVGPIGGVEGKVVAAAAAGATIILVPADQAEEARSREREGLTIIPVATLEDAIRALRDTA